MLNQARIRPFPIKIGSGADTICTVFLKNLSAIRLAPTSFC